jgi:hypothetical protein
MAAALSEQIDPLAAPASLRPSGRRNFPISISTVTTGCPPSTACGDGTSAAYRGPMSLAGPTLSTADLGGVDLRG